MWGMDVKTGQWRTKFNRESQEGMKMVTINGFIKSQRMVKKTCNAAWFESSDKVYAGLDAQRPWDRPRNRWTDVVKKDLEDL